MLTRLRLATRQGEAGMTLVELLVAMMIFSFVLALVGSAIASMTGSAVRVNGTGQAVAQVDKVFNRLDKQVPYARGVNLPAQVGDRWYVEFLTRVSAGGQPAGCWQYRFDESDRELLARRSAEGSSASVGAWDTVATGVERRGTAVPFTTLRTGTSYDGSVTVDGYHRQRLTVALQLASAGAPAQVLESTWVARNSTPEFETDVPRVCDGMPRT